MTRVLSFLGIISAAVIACVPTTPERAQPALVERARVSMGSELRIAVWTDDERRAPGATDAINRVFAQFTRLEALMAVWRADSDISRLNAAAGRQPVAVSP